MPLTMAGIGETNTISRIGGNEETRRFLANKSSFWSLGKWISTVVVTKIEGDSAYKRRIMDMGITKGSELYIRKVAPLGDPVEITVRGYELSVRKDDAQCVQVK